MFGTLLGALPSPPEDVAPSDPGRGPADEGLRALLGAQESVGLEPLADGAGATEAGPDVVPRWLRAAALTEAPVKAVLVGPWTSAYRALHARPGERAVVSRAERLRETVEALAAAGCPLVDVEEAEADRIGDDSTARQVFREAHIRIAREVHGTHLSLSIVGGSAWEAGAATILDAPYASLAVDLIAGPENWRLVAVAPHERGIVVGVIDPANGTDDGPELPVWAAHYAASTRGRGLARVGIGTAGSLARLPWPVALAKLRALGEAVRVAGLPGGDLADALDPRAVSIRSAALGRAARRRGRP